MAATDDPFTQVHDALWALAETSTVLTNLVRVSARIRLNDAKRGPVKTEVGEADKPELRLLPVNGFMFGVRDSHKGTVRKRFHWVVSTGDQRPKEELYPLEWELYRTLAAWKTPMQALTWNGKAFVYDAYLTEYEETWKDKEHNRGIPGWTGLLTTVVEMHFDRTDLPVT